MLTVEIRISGALITGINVVNRGVGDVNGLTSEYEYQGCTFPIDNVGPVKTFNGRLKHIRSEGANKLIRLILQAIPKEDRS
jgi:hypothetical protein